ncbi:hypothetical protein LCGC14_1707980, partial [marine sediment metagenome]
DWTIASVVFKGGPFLEENTTAAYLMGFARTGGVPVRVGYYFPTGATGTLTATGGHTPFQGTTDDVGTLWLVKHARTDNKTSTFDSDDNSIPTDLTAAIRIKGDYTATFEPIATTEEAKLWRKQGDGGWQEYRSFREPTAYSATENEGDVYYAMSRSVNTIGGTLVAKNQYNRGVVKVVTHNSTTVANVIVVDAVLSDNATDAAVTTPMWAEGAWGEYRGYPRTVNFFEDRLWWASSTNYPDTMWGSQTSDYENMEYSDLGLDTDAIIAPLKDNEVSQIQWMMSRRVMAIGAANREYSLAAQNPEDPITPLDKKSTPQTGFSSGSIQPVMLNDSIFFLQRQGKKLGAMKFDSVTENFVVDDATLLAYGLLDSPPTNIAVSRSPDSLIWVVRTDGVMPTFTYEPKEEVSGWGRQLTQNSANVNIPLGFFESTAVIHGTTEDEIWVCVRRSVFLTDAELAIILSYDTTPTNDVIDMLEILQALDDFAAGTLSLKLVTIMQDMWAEATLISSMGSYEEDVYYIELFAPRDWGSDIEDAKFVDSLVTYDDVTASSAMTGLDHLEGKTVSVFADGVVFDDAVVASGAITLKKATVITTASVVQMGLPYTMKGRSMRLAVPQSPSALQTKIKRVTSVTTRYIRSLLGSAGVEYDIKDTENGTVTEFLTDIGALYSTESADTPKTDRATEGGFNEEAYTVILSDDPVPFTALATITEVEV